MIGLVDYDLQTTSLVGLVPPNIEIMKLATYYKNEENTFCRLIDLKEEELSSYDKIYFFSEQEKYPEIPDAFKRANNIIFGGTAFTYNYQPFENSIIDFTLPRIGIYKEFLKQKYQDGIKTKIINHVLDDTYYRNYAGLERLPLPPIIPQKRIFLYDKDFFYPDWEETIEEISLRKPSSIFRIHPIICKNLTNYFKLRNYTKISRTTSIILDIDIPLSEVNYMLKKYSNLFLADITETSNIYIPLGDTFSTSFHYYKDYIYKLNLLYSFWSYEIPIKIKYIYPQIGLNDPLYHLSKLTESWSNGKTKLNKTLSERTTIKNKKNIPIERTEKDLLLKFYPEAKDLFNQNYTLVKERRYWRV